MRTIEFTIKNREGLHARPATNFCEVATSFSCQINVGRKGETEFFNAKSIIGVLCLGASQGETIVITVDGEDEEIALKNLVNVLEQVK